MTIKHSRNLRKASAVNIRIPGIVLITSMSYDWLMVTKATTDQSQLMLATKAIPETLVPKIWCFVLLSLWSVNQTNERKFLKNKF